MPATIKDVANYAGVSTATVSYVINKTRYVSAKTQQKVKKAMAALSYAPSALAKNLRTQRTQTIGLIVPQLSNPSFTDAVHGVENILQKNGYSLLISESEEIYETELNLIKVFNSLLLDGLIIIPSGMNTEKLHGALRKNCPIVFLDRRPEGFPCDSVVLDNYDSTYTAITMLIKAGHHHIGLLLGSEHLSTTRDRIFGYKQAYSDAGLAFEPGLILYGDFGLESGRILSQKILSEFCPTAIMAASSDMTLGVFLTAKEKGMSIPKDLSIVGSHDLPWAKATEPPLTMIYQPTTEMGKRAASLLLKRISSPSADFETLFVPSELVVRGST